MYVVVGEYATKYIVSLALVLSGAMEFAKACTSAIISGKVTPDGRPIMWKNRDAENLKNCVRSHLSRSFHNPLMVST